MTRVRWLRSGALVALVPAMFAVDLWVPASNVLPTGIREALGCSGAGNVPARDGWTWLQPALVSVTPGQALPVATDGFFAILAEVNGLSAADASEQLRVVVTDAAGVEIAGEVRLLGSEREGSYIFGWTALEPLAVGAVFTLTLATEPATTGIAFVGGQFPLVVAGEPTPLPEPALGFESWARFYHGSGNTVSCRPRTDCGTIPPLTIPSNMVDQVSALAHWSMPEVTGGVAWRLHIELGPEQGDIHPPGNVITVFGSNPEFESQLGELVFPNQQPRYCATLVLTDLRTGTARRAERCSPAGEFERASSDTQLAACVEPPLPELTRIWCELRAPAMSPQCEALTAPLPGPDATEDGPDLANESSQPSSSCQLGRVRTSASAWAGIAGVALVVLRRRRRRRSGG
jgi:hypothetical protein